MAASLVSASLVYGVDDPSRTCASEPELRRKVAARLGYDPFEAHAPWLFRVRIDGRRKRPHAEIVMERGGRAMSEREFDEATCDALSEAVATTIATAIDPLAAAPVPSPPEASPPADVPPPPPLRPTEAPAPPAPAPPEGPPAEHTRVVPLVYLDGTAALGRTAGVALGGRVGAGLQYRGLSLGGEARGEVSPFAVELTAFDRVSWSLVSGALVACGHAGFFELCGVAALGSLQATAREVARPGLESTLFATLGARVGMGLPLTADVALRGNVELGIPLVRTTFVIDGQPAWTAPVVHGTLGVGAEARFR